MKKVKRIRMQIVIALITMFALSNMFVINARAASITKAEVTGKLNNIVSQYSGKTSWPSSFGSQCYSFAHFVFNTVFDRNTTVGSYSTGTEYKFNTPARDVKILGSLGPGYTDAQLESLLDLAQPGDYVQLKRRTGSAGPHSEIVLDVNPHANTITILDANSGSISNQVRTYTQNYFTDSNVRSFRNWNQGVTIYRYKDYVVANEPQTHSPVGHLDTFSAGDGSINLGGWAYDPDNTSQPIDLRIEVGNSTYTVKANQTIDGYNAEKNGHAVSTTISVGERGVHTVKVWALDLNGDNNTLLATKTLTINSNTAPIGSVDSIGGGENLIGLSGWAHDADTPGQQVTLKLEIVGGSSYTFTTEGIRGNGYPGFSVRIPVKEKGTYEVKVYALDQGPYQSESKNTLLKTTTVTIRTKHVNSYIDTSTEKIANTIGTVKGMDGTLKIEGWVQDIHGIDRVEYEVLDVAQSENGVKGICEHRKRDDVANANPGYPTGNEGFYAYIPYKDLRHLFYYPEKMKIILTAYCKGGDAHNLGEIGVTRSFNEKTGPEISDIEITDVSFRGYTIKAIVSDPLGIERVQFPTWTLKNGQDDIIDDWGMNEAASGTIVGNTVTYRVNTSEHNNETGMYKTHIYAYDKLGNFTALPINDSKGEVNVPKISEIKLSKTNAELNLGKTLALTYTVVPEMEQDLSDLCIWSSTDEKVATVKDGVITAVAEGNATIMLTIEGVLAECHVTVVKPQKTVFEITDITSTACNKLTLHWKPYNGADGYLVYKIDSEENASIIKNITNASITSYVDTVTSGVKNTYKIAAYYLDDTKKVILAESSVKSGTALPATGHQHTELRNAKEATCTQNGYTGDTYCKDCNTKLSSGETIAKTGHAWDNGAITTKATCTAKGVKTYICANCKSTKTEEIPATGHQHTELRNVKEATCTQNGYTGDSYCKDCNTKLSSGKTIAKTGHTWDGGKVTKKATCTTKGVKTYTCTICESAKTEEIEATGHQHTEVKNSKAATCTQDGYTGDTYCKDCNTKLSTGKKITKTGHVWDAGKVTTNATCTTKGSKIYTCSNCGATKKEEIPATGHLTKITKFAKEASCKSEGYTGDIYCQDCGKLIEEGNVIAKKEHAWDDGKVTVQPTTTSTGSKKFTCQNCGTTRTESIAKLPVQSIVGKTVQDKSSNGIYKVLQGNSVEFKKTISKKSSVKVPDTIKISGKSYKVVTISANAFYNNTVLRTITIGKNVTTIGTNAFGGCKNLSKISGAARVTKISDKAFYNCSALTTVTISAGVKTIGKQAFYNCKALRTITIQTSKLTSKTVGSNAFAKTYSKPTVKVPAKQFTAYKKLLPSRGMSTKAVYKK